MPLSRSLSADFDFSQLKQNWMGEWNEGTIYNINDTVRLNGKAYVCNSTYFSENHVFGHENKPGVDTTNWTLVINGSIYKGNWGYKDRHYIGDIVRYNEDYYQCVEDNFGGHPIYENGGLSSKWTKIAETSRQDKSRNHVWFANYPPMGWTRNNCETTDQYGNPGYVNVCTINGNYELNFSGRIHSNIGWGLGERTTWLASNDSNASTTWTYVRNAGFDHWDWLDGYRPSITGAEPRLVQVCGTDEFTLALFDTGEVYHTGYGGHGQNGDGTTSDYAYFRRVGRSGGRGTGVLRDVRIIKVGHSAKTGHMGEISTHSCYALSDAGAVYTWGYNGYGQLGHGNTTNYSTPTQIDQTWFHNKKIVDMWMGGYNYQIAYAQTEDGDLYSWGYNGDGGLGNGHFRNQYRPERVAYNWAKFGGIKKLVINGSDAENLVVVLTNNGELHATGNYGDASYPVYGVGNAPQAAISYFQPLARLYEARANSRGIGNKMNDFNIMNDVLRKVEDFWSLGHGQAHNLIVKEIGTGLMYGVGWVANNIFTTYQKQLGYNEYAGDTQWSMPNLSSATLLSMGNMTDIKYVHKQSSGQNTNGLCFLNSDGRMWVSGANTAWSKGLGNAGTPDPTASHTRGMRNRLPWEHWFRSNSPAQPRWAEPVSMVVAIANDGSTGGFGALTTNGRFVCAFGGVSWYYGWDPASNPSQVGYSHGNYMRHSL